ncbi:hypothetical protein [Nonomuraea sp. NPDC002799]
MRKFSAGTIVVGAVLAFSGAGVGVMVASGDVAPSGHYDGVVAGHIDGGVAPAGDEWIG